MLKYLTVILAVAMAVPALAAFNNTFPRTRMFSEIGRPEAMTPEDNSRRRTTSTTLRDIDFKANRSYSTEKLRFGASLEYANNFLYRDFAINESGFNSAFNVYGSFYGVEASLFAVSDLNDKDDVDQPLLTEMRLSYTFKFDTSINTVAFTYQEWSTTPGAIGTVGQGFGNNPPVFEDEAMEINLSSYWFTEKIQPNNMNLYMGFDADIWVDEPGFRTAITGGIFANKQADGYLPNGARLQGSLFFQSDYHTDTASTPGVEVYVEAFWDMRFSTESALPLIFLLYGQYYLPLDDDPVDLITFGARLELAF